MTAEDLIRDFDKKGIPYHTPGFYDHPNFLAVERMDATYLERYALFVLGERAHA
jgi:hypothetical protein